MLEIAGYVETVQNATSSTLVVTTTILERILESVTGSTDLVREVMVATQEYGKGTSEILETSVVEMSEMTQRVAQAGEQQKEGGNMVVESVEQIARIAREHLRAAEELSDATVGLAREAQVLKELSGEFRLSARLEPVTTR